MTVCAPVIAAAAPFAAHVMDARTGKTLHAQNADTKLHPASLTKMMTLYMAFSAIERGQVRLDSKFLISSHAANQPPSKLGLRPGQRIELRYLIRAAAVKSCNDAATAIGEGLAGSEPAFAQQMTQMARALGMNGTSFKNANGLTASGHYSTARDMSVLGRHLFYDFPQYYNIFSRRNADAGIATVTSTNRHFLDNYRGADGIKTGYTRAAGFNLTASAQQGKKRVIATVFGGTSTAQRNAVMGELLDAGFKLSPNNVRETRPRAPQYIAERKVVRKGQTTTAAVEAVTLASSRKPERKQLPVTQAAAVVPTEQLTRALRDAIASAPPEAAAPVRAASRLSLGSSNRPLRRPGNVAPQPQTEIATSRPEPSPKAAPNPAAAASTAGLERSERPRHAPRSEARNAAGGNQIDAALVEAHKPITLAEVAAPARPEDQIIISASFLPSDQPAATEIVSRASSSGGRQWGITLGQYRSRHEADQLLLKTALQETASLDVARRNIVDTKRGFDASFVGMTKAEAVLTCQRLVARQQGCRVVGP